MAPRQFTSATAMVDEMKAERVSLQAVCSESRAVRVRTKHGTEATMNVEKIGRQTSRWLTGRVVQFGDRGYGWIRPREINAAGVFVHVSDCPSQLPLHVGQLVRFRIGFDCWERPKAVDVAPTEEV